MWQSRAPPSLPACTGRVGVRVYVCVHIYMYTRTGIHMVIGGRDDTTSQTPEAQCVGMEMLARRLVVFSFFFLELLYGCALFRLFSYANLHILDAHRRTTKLIYWICFIICKGYTHSTRFTSIFFFSVYTNTKNSKNRCQSVFTNASIRIHQHTYNIYIYADTHFVRVKFEERQQKLSNTRTTHKNCSTSAWTRLPVTCEIFTMLANREDQLRFRKRDGPVTKRQNSYSYLSPSFTFSVRSWECVVPCRCNCI